MIVFQTRNTPAFSGAYTANGFPKNCGERIFPMHESATLYPTYSKTLVTLPWATYHFGIYFLEVRRYLTLG